MLAHNACNENPRPFWNGSSKADTKVYSNRCPFGERITKQRLLCITYIIILPAFTKPCA